MSSLAAHKTFWVTVSPKTGTGTVYHSLAAALDKLDELSDAEPDAYADDFYADWLPPNGLHIHLIGDSLLEAVIWGIKNAMSG